MKRPKLPAALTKVIITKFALSMGHLVGFILIAVFFSDRLYLGLLPGAFALFLGMDAVATIYNCLTDNYVTVVGECTKVELSRFKRRITAVWIKSNRGTVKVLLRHRPKAIEVGDTLTVHTPFSASVFERGEYMVMNEYYTVSIAKKQN